MDKETDYLSALDGMEDELAESEEEETTPESTDADVLFAEVEARLDKLRKMFGRQG